MRTHVRCSAPHAFALHNLQCIARVEPLTVDTIAMQSPRLPRENCHSCMNAHHNRRCDHSTPFSPCIVQMAAASPLGSSPKQAGSPDPTDFGLSKSATWRIKGASKSAPMGGGQVDEEARSIVTLVTLPLAASTAQTATRGLS